MWQLAMKSSIITWHMIEIANKALKTSEEPYSFNLIGTTQSSIDEIIVISPTPNKGLGNFEEENEVPIPDDDWNWDTVDADTDDEN